MYLHTGLQLGPAVLVGGVQGGACAGLYLIHHLQHDKGQVSCKPQAKLHLSDARHRLSCIERSNWSCLTPPAA